MVNFLTNRQEVSAILSYSDSYGIVSPDGYGAGSPFSVTPVTGIGGRVQVKGGYIIDSLLRAYKVPDTVLDIPNDGNFYFLKVSYAERNYEEGTVQVDANGNVSGTVSFVNLVRGQNSGVPTCIRFIKEDGTEPLNKGVYEVVDIVDNNNIILSSGVVIYPEAGLRVIVLGSIPMGRSFTDEQLEGIYTYDSYKYTLVQSEGRIPEKEDETEYWIARLQNVAGVVNIEEERTEFWHFAGGGGQITTWLFSVNPTPSDAEVWINDERRSSIRIRQGDTVHYVVYKYGYLLVDSTYTLVSGENVTLDVTLEVDPDAPTDAQITVATQSGDVSLGAVNLNNSMSIDRASASLTVEAGTAVQICAQAAPGCSFEHWLKDGVVYNSNPIQEVIADRDTVYTAVFREGVADYVDFMVVLGSGHEEFTVLTSAGNGSTEVFMVQEENS